MAFVQIFNLNSNKNYPHSQNFHTKISELGYDWNEFFGTVQIMSILHVKYLFETLLFIFWYNIRTKKFHTNQFANLERILTNLQTGGIP